MITTFDKIYKITSVMLSIGAFLFFIALAQLMMWSFDRSPPFVVLAYDAPPTHRGGVAVIKASVKRDLDRKCSVTYSRMFLDSKGASSDLTDGMRMMGATALDELNRRSPDGLTLKVHIPDTAETGKALVITALEYVCNPLHQIYPISVTMLNEIVIL